MLVFMGWYGLCQSMRKASITAGKSKNFLVSRPESKLVYRKYPISSGKKVRRNYQVGFLPALY